VAESVVPQLPLDDDIKIKNFAKACTTTGACKLLSYSAANRSLWLQSPLVIAEKFLLLQHLGYTLLLAYY
jgi:hypothetical protein